MNCSRKRKTQSLFVPVRRTSVIKHTKDIKSCLAHGYLHNEPTYVDVVSCSVDKKRHEKDSGMDDSFEDDQSVFESAKLNEDSATENCNTNEIPNLKLKTQSSSPDQNTRACSGTDMPGNLDFLRNILADSRWRYLKVLYEQADKCNLQETVDRMRKEELFPQTPKLNLFSAKNDLRQSNDRMTKECDSIDEGYTSSASEIYRQDLATNLPEFHGLQNTSQSTNYLFHSDDEQTASTVVAEKGKFWRCEYCHKNFSNSEASRRHLLTHKGVRTHKCQYCSRSFYDQPSYARHLKSHNGDKAHKCAQCSMAFSKRSALEVHMRSHTGERPFVCQFCNKGFSISGNLHRHVLIHTGRRPYKCGKCPRAFNNPSHLARHISSFHT